MKRSTGRILTTHTGSLPWPPDLLEMLLQKEEGRQDYEIEDKGGPHQVGKTWGSKDD